MSKNRQIRSRCSSGAPEAGIPKAALDACCAHAGVKRCKTLNLGEFDTKIEAALAYDRGAIVLEGDLARPNYVWMKLPIGAYRLAIKASGEPVENTEDRTLAEMPKLNEPPPGAANLGA